LAIANCSYHFKTFTFIFVISLIRIICNCYMKVEVCSAPNVLSSIDMLQANISTLNAAGEAARLRINISKIRR